jgi:hypothetical protein
VVFKLLALGFENLGAIGAFKLGGHMILEFRIMSINHFDPRKIGAGKLSDHYRLQKYIILSYQYFHLFAR